MKTILRTLVIGIGFFGVMAAAHADIASPLVSVEEKILYDANGNWEANQYVVTSNSGNKNHMIWAFGVTNPVAMYAWTTRTGWSATTLSREEWNDGRLFQSTWCNEFECMNYETGSGGVSEGSASFILGSFESLFGTEENYVNFYWSVDFAQIGLGPESSSDEFYFSAPPASEYAAFGDQGQLIYQSFNNIPEPGSLVLIGLAFAGLTASRRRRIG